MKRSHVGLAVVGAAAALAALWMVTMRSTGDGAPATRAAGQRAAAGGNVAEEPAGGGAPSGAAGGGWDRDPEGPLRLEGQVLDPDGVPVADALVSLGTLPTRTTRSQSDGSFAFDKLISRTFFLQARAGRLVGFATYKLTSDSDPVAVRLRLGSTLAVRVQDEDARPLSGVRVRVETGRAPGEDEWLAVSDEAGKVLLQGVPMGWASVHAEAEGYAPGRSDAVIGEPDPDPGVATSEVTLVLRRGVAVSGRVVDEAGAPIGGARVRPIQLRAWIDPDALPVIIADERGAFRFPALAAGRYTFAALSSSHGRAESPPVDVAEQPVRDVTVTLPAGGVLAGAVVDKQGAEVPFAVVRVSPHADDPQETYRLARLARQVASDAQGRFEIRGLARAKLQVLAEGERAASAVTEVSLVEALRRDGLRLVLELDGEISGLVVDAAGEPVPEVEVRAFADPAAGASAEPFALSRSHAASTDGSGRFALTGLTASAYRIWAGASGKPFGPGSATAAVGARDVRLVLEKAGRIVGKLVAEGGKPPALATVYATGQLPVTTRTGSFAVNEVPPGEYSLTVRSPDHLQVTRQGFKVTPGKDTDVGTLELSGGRRLTGRVLDAQQRPVAGARVSAGRHLFGDDDDQDAPFREDPDGVQGPSATRSDATGAFELRGLEPGAPLQVSASHARGRSEVVEIAAGAGELAPLTLRLRGVGSVAGVVTVGGKPAADFFVLLRPKGESRGTGHQAVTAPDGSYFIGRVGEGDYLASATRRGGGRDQPRPVAVVAGQRAALDFALEGGALSLAVPVSALPGHRVDAAHVFLFEGSVAIASPDELRERRAAAISTAFWFQRTPPPFFTGLVAGGYTVCAQPVTADLSDSAAFKRAMEQSLITDVTCKAVRLAATPAEQTFALALPSMKPATAPAPK